MAYIEFEDVKKIYGTGEAKGYSYHGNAHAKQCAFVGVDTCCGQEHGLFGLLSHSFDAVSVGQSVCMAQCGQTHKKGMQCRDAFRHEMIIHVLVCSTVVHIHQSGFGRQFQFLSQCLGGQMGNDKRNSGGENPPASLFQA